MKKLMSLMIGLSLAIGAVSVSFAADEAQKDTTKKSSKKKGGKKKKSETKKEG